MHFLVVCFFISFCDGRLINIFILCLLLPLSSTDMERCEITTKLNGLTSIYGQPAAYELKRLNIDSTAHEMRANHIVVTDAHCYISD